MGATRTTAPGVPAGGRRCRRAPSTWAWALLAFPGAAGAATFGESSTRACTEMWWSVDERAALTAPFATIGMAATSSGGAVQVVVAGADRR